VIVEITSNLTHVAKPHQVLIDISTTDGAASGLLVNSAVRCERLHTIQQGSVIRVIGTLSTSLMPGIDASLKAALAIA